MGRNRPIAENVIDSKSIERASSEKPASTFSQRALARPDRAESRDRKGLGSKSKSWARLSRKTASRFFEDTLYPIEELLNNENAGRTDVRPAPFRSTWSSDQGMSPATNFGITGPPISAAKRRFDGVKKNSRPPIWLSVS